MNLKEQYRKLLNTNNKVLNIHHKDLDGVSSSIILKNIYKNIDYKELKYGEVDGFLKTINYKNYDAIILTDISPESITSFEHSDKIFLLDHHDTALQYHSPENNRIVLNGKSATKLVKEFYENLFNIDLSYLNDFVEVVNDYDMWILKDVRSWGLNELYFKYWDNNFRNRFKSGDMYFTVQEVDHIKLRRKELEEVYNKVETYNFDIINGTLIIANTFINDICHKLMHEKGFNIVCCYNPKTKHISVRSKMVNIHIGEVLREVLGSGAGGHKNSAAFSVNDYSEINEKLDLLENYLKGKL